MGSHHPHQLLVIITQEVLVHPYAQLLCEGSFSEAAQKNQAKYHLNRRNQLFRQGQANHHANRQSYECSSSTRGRRPCPGRCRTTHCTPKPPSPSPTPESAIANRKFHRLTGWLFSEAFGEDDQAASAAGPPPVIDSRVGQRVNAVAADEPVQRVTNDAHGRLQVAAPTNPMRRRNSKSAKPPWAPPPVILKIANNCQRNNQTVTNGDSGKDGDENRSRRNNNQPARQITKTIYTTIAANNIELHNIQSRLGREENIQWSKITIRTEVSLSMQFVVEE